MITLELHNKRVNHYLLDVSWEDLREELSRTQRIKGGSDLELKVLKETLLCKIPSIRMFLFRKYDSLDDSAANEIVQEMLSQHYLTLSDAKDRPGLYFRVLNQEETLHYNQFGSPPVNH